MSTITENSTWTCPACNGTGVTGSRWPQALRVLEERGRFTIPWAVTARTYRVELRGACVWFVPDPQGLAAVCDPGGVNRLTIPAEFRAVLGLRPGADVALAREGTSLLVWKHEAAGC